MDKEPEEKKRRPKKKKEARNDMQFKTATMDDFDVAFQFIEQLWTYNIYDYNEVKEVYTRAITNSDVFVFFLIENGEYIGFCHGDYIDTFWMSGQTCYVSSIITKEEVRGKGYGVKLMDHAVELAKKRGCKAMILDSGFPRTRAHRFYEAYGFEKSCYGFEMKLSYEQK